MAKKSETIFVCSECGFESPKWMGQCVCGAWNSLHEERIKQPAPAGRGRSAAAGVDKTEGWRGGMGRPAALGSIVSGAQSRIDTGIGELNRVLGGGLTKGTLTLIAGEPGIGKSTLILQAAICVSRQGMTVLYVSGEES